MKTVQLLKGAIPTSIKQLLPRTKDPLLSSSTAQHYTLPSGALFIVRPPCSSLPPSMPYPQLQSTSRSASATSPSNPFQTHAAPVFLHSTRAEHLIPSSRRPSPPRSPLTVEEVASLQALRISAPSYWTRSKLASKFDLSPKVVGTLGWGDDLAGKAAEKFRKEEVESEKSRKEGSWGWKKRIAREERRRRRSMW